MTGLVDGTIVREQRGFACASVLPWLSKTDRYEETLAVIVAKIYSPMQACNVKLDSAFATPAYVDMR